MTPPFLRAVLDGEFGTASALIRASIPPRWPGQPDERRFLGDRLSDLLADPSLQPWLIRALVHRDERRIVGHAGFHGPPDGDGIAEVGYTVFPGHRRRGHAEEAVRALLAWASETHGVRRFRASVSPTNQPSLRLVRKLGFIEVGTRWEEEDGEELVFRLEAVAPPPGRG